MPEIHDNSSEFRPYQPGEDPEQRRKKIDRRDFLTMVGGAAGAVGLGAALGYAGKKEQEAEQAEAKKHEQVGDAIIFKKVDQSGSVSIIPLPGKFPSDIPVVRPEQWVLYFKIGQAESSLAVSKKEFDSYKEGQTVRVKYDDRTMKVETVEK